MASESKELATTRRRNLKHGEELGTRLIAAAQTVERHEITRYGAPVACAKRLGLSVATDIIQEMWVFTSISNDCSPCKPKSGEGDPPTDAGRNTEADFWGERRPNETHASTTDPHARRKGAGKEAKLCFLGHALMENRSGLVVGACLTRADGHAERAAALALIEPYADRPRTITLGLTKPLTPRTLSTSCRP
jgi:hypothetical protein